MSNDEVPFPFFIQFQFLSNGICCIHRYTNGLMNPSAFPENGCCVVITHSSLIEEMFDQSPLVTVAMVQWCFGEYSRGR